MLPMNNKTIFGLFVLLLGIGMLFFIQTKGIGPFLIGFGASFGAFSLRGGKK